MFVQLTLTCLVTFARICSNNVSNICSCYYNSHILLQIGLTKCYAFKGVFCKNVSQPHSGHFMYGSHSIADIWHHEWLFISFMIGKIKTNNDFVTNISARISLTTYKCINCHRLSNVVCLELQCKWK